MALDWENILNFSTQIYPFDSLQYQEENHENDFLLSLETELLCFNSLPPPSLLHGDYHNHDLIPFHNHIEFPPGNFFTQFDEEDYYTQFQRLILPCFDTQSNSIPVNSNQNQRVSLSPEKSFTQDYCTQYLPCSKKQRLNLPYFDAEFNLSPVYSHNPVLNGKGKTVSAQSRAARERRRKITEKTHELGKLVPGGSKMNTAEMLQSAFKYVQFLQAQLRILQSMQTFIHENDIKINLDNLPLLASEVVQEKLYTKEKCLISQEFLPVFEEICNFDINLKKPN